MPSNIYSLSLELANNLAESLNTEDLLNLRLGSSFLRDCAMFTFVKRYFYQQAHVVTPESLECLLAVSRHKVFGRAIRTIVISDQAVGSARANDKSLDGRDSSLGLGWLLYA